LYAYISGELVFKSPTLLIVDNMGIGYQLNVSLNTYMKVQDASKAKLYVYTYLREQEVPVMYGFAEISERDIFLQLISVSGIGPNTARMILSAYQAEEVRLAILQENISLLKSIKGIGPKTAQRLVLELKDKIAKSGEISGLAPTLHNTEAEDALSALLILGFVKSEAQKAIQKIQKSDPTIISAELLIKEALKIL
jgi:Holliday junction DNA helicase RuvA